MTLAVWPRSLAERGGESAGRLRGNLRGQRSADLVAPGWHCNRGVRGYVGVCSGGFPPSLLLVGFPQLGSTAPVNSPHPSDDWHQNDGAWGSWRKVWWECNDG